MKQYLLKFNILAISALCFLFTNCEGLDEGTDGTIAAGTYYSDINTLTPGVAGIYGTLHRNIWSIDYMAHYTGADDLTSRTTHSNKWVVLEADQFNRSAGNSWTTNDYNGNYKTILACNSFIKNANPPGIEEAAINAAKANAYFVRAFCYFRLAMTFGDVPMPLNPEADLEISLTPKREVITQVISDLKFAIEWADNVRDVNPLDENGRVSKTAARAYLAKVYLQLTGYPFNEDKWLDVKTLTRKIITDGVYSLTDDYAHCFQEPHQTNREMIFAHKMGFESDPIVTQNRTYGNRWGNWMDCYMEWAFYDGFPDGYRKTFSAIADASNKYFVTHGNPIVTKFFWGTAKGTDHLNATEPIDNIFEHKWQTSNDRAGMRYAEVLLMYAEACANTGETDEAITKLNLVKRRAYAKGATKQVEVLALPANFWQVADPTIDYTNIELNSPEKIIDAIIKERAYEFVGEIGGNRWLDLLRLEKIVEVTNLRDGRDLPLVGDPSDSNNWWTPIPASETVLNPNLIPE